MGGSAKLASAKNVDADPFNCSIDLNPTDLDVDVSFAQRDAEMFSSNEPCTH